ncbi:MAG: peptidylprolyl isomerase [Candidatus Limnocylindrales bacterium]|jgi:cyclophilin family peptidyl-prolyl cis-trans isomerase
MTTATIDTDKGAIEIELSPAGAPRATANFVELAQKGYYDGVVFHRLVPGFVIQGGDGEYGHIDRLDRGRLGTGGPGYKFADEPFEGDYVRGAVAMANAGPNTNGSQFFICLTDLSGGRLPKKYTLFGTVTKGMDVVDAIAASKCDGRDQPAEPTAMRSVKIGN